MSSFHHHIKSGAKGKAADHAAYIARKGKFSDREDLVCTGYGNMPTWAQKDPFLFWKAADKYERANGAAYREHEIALPEELAREQQKDLVKNLIEGLVGNKPYQFAVHAPNSALGETNNTHLHLMYSSRLDDGIERTPEQMFGRYNGKHPELGGCRKDSGGKSPLVLRDEVIAIRKKCADIQNEALQMWGHTGRVDHRTLKQQGIDRTPERHLGAARIKKMTQADKEKHVATRKSCQKGTNSISI